MKRTILLPFILVSFIANGQVSTYLSLGTNSTRVNETQSFSVFSADSDSKNYDTKNGYQFAIGVQIPLSEIIRLDVSGGYLQKGYSAIIEGDVFFSSISEKLTFVSLPIKLNLSPFDSKLHPYSEFGLVYSRLLKSEITSSRSGGTTFILEDLNNFDQRNTNIFSIIFGIGMEYDFTNSSIFLVANYTKGLSQMNIPEKRYSNQALVGDLQYVDSDFKLDNFQVNVGFSFQL